MEREYFWGFFVLFFQKLNKKKNPNILFCTTHPQCACVGSVRLSITLWISLVNIHSTTWILSSGFKHFLPRKKTILRWLTRTEKAPERPELPLLDSCPFIPLLALITWRWNKKIVSLLLLLLQQTLLSSGMTLKFSPAKVLTSCRC